MLETIRNSFSSVRSSGHQEDLFERIPLNTSWPFKSLRASTVKLPGLICSPQSLGLVSHSGVLETHMNKPQYEAKTGLSNSRSWGWGLQVEAGSPLVEDGALTSRDSSSRNPQQTRL